MADALRNRTQRLLAATQKRTTETMLRGDRGYESLSDADVSSSSSEGTDDDSRSDLLTDAIEDSGIRTPISPPPHQHQLRTPTTMAVPGIPLHNSTAGSMNSSTTINPHTSTLPPQADTSSAGRPLQAVPGTPRSMNSGSNSFIRSGRPQHILGLSQLSMGSGIRNSSSTAAVNNNNNVGTPTSQSGSCSPYAIPQHIPVQRQFESDDEVPMSARRVIPSHTEPTPAFKAGALALRPTSLGALKQYQFSGLTANRIFNQRTCNLLVIGGTQVGKSSLINTYRAVVTHNEKWPMAPVGICGRYGTTVVDPCPNHSTAPTWLLIDTPGKTYMDIDDDDSDDAIVLSRLFEGVEWKTKLLGKGSISVSALSQQDPTPLHKAHQCIVVVNVCDLVVDKGRMRALRWADRYEPTPQAPLVVTYLQSLLHRIRELQEDTPPFVVVTQMDRMGGVACAGAREAALISLRKCATVNSIYFTACPSFDAGPRERENPLAYTTDVDTRSEVLRLHQDIMSSVSWSIVQKPDLLQEMLESNLQERER